MIWVSINRPALARPHTALAASESERLRTLLGSGEDGVDLVALALLGHRGQGLGAVISCQRVLPAAEDGAAHPDGRRRRLVLQIPIITHGPGRAERKERRSGWRRTCTGGDKEKEELELQEQKGSTTER